MTDESVHPYDELTTLITADTWYCPSLAAPRDLHPNSGSASQIAISYRTTHDLVTISSIRDRWGRKNGCCHLSSYNAPHSSLFLITPDIRCLTDLVRVTPLAQSSRLKTANCCTATFSSMQLIAHPFASLSVTVIRQIFFGFSSAYSLCNSQQFGEAVTARFSFQKLFTAPVPATWW